MEMITPPKWFCKHCMTFSDHIDIKEDTKGQDFLILSGECCDCKKTNLNYFPKFKPNPMFGIGKIDLV